MVVEQDEELVLSLLTNMEMANLHQSTVGTVVESGSTCHQVMCIIKQKNKKTFPAIGEKTCTQIVALKFEIQNNST